MIPRWNIVKSRFHWTFVLLAVVSLCVTRLEPRLDIVSFGCWGVHSKANEMSRPLMQRIHPLYYMGPGQAGSLRRQA